MQIGVGDLITKLVIFVCLFSCYIFQELKRMRDMLVGDVGHGRIRSSQEAVGWS